VDSEVFSIALFHFAQEVCAGQHRRIMLVLDRAGWHESEQVVVPEGIHLLFLPPYSPELQPCERLWPLTNEAIANRHFETLSELQAVQAERCVVLADDPLRLRQHTMFSWWPRALRRSGDPEPG
jgi:transposase